MRTRTFEEVDFQGNPFEMIHNRKIWSGSLGVAKNPYLSEPRLFRIAVGKQTLLQIWGTAMVVPVGYGVVAVLRWTAAVSTDQALLRTAVCRPPVPPTAAAQPRVCRGPPCACLIRLLLARVLACPRRLRGGGASRCAHVLYFSFHFVFTCLVFHESDIFPDSVVP